MQNRIRSNGERIWKNCISFIQRIEEWIKFIQIWTRRRMCVVLHKHHSSDHQTDDHQHNKITIIIGHYYFSTVGPFSIFWLLSDCHFSPHIYICILFFKCSMFNCDKCRPLQHTHMYNIVSTLFWHSKYQKENENKRMQNYHKWIRNS